MPNEIPLVFYNGSNYDYHFIIKEKQKSLMGNLNALGKIRKSTNPFFFFNRKRSEKKLIKMVMKDL